MSRHMSHYATLQHLPRSGACVRGVLAQCARGVVDVLRGCVDGRDGPAPLPHAGYGSM